MLLAATMQHASAQKRSKAPPPPPVEKLAPNAPMQAPAFAGQTRAPGFAAPTQVEVIVVANGLENPWGLEFLPTGDMLVSERGGRLRIVSVDGALSEPVTGLPQIEVSRQGGLLDIALDPDFKKTQMVYFAFSETDPAGGNHTAVGRGKLTLGPAPALSEVRIIYRQVPSAKSAFHFGGRLVFGRDNKLYVTQGERGLTPGRPQAQDKSSLFGKIVRIEKDGSIPGDNPFVKDKTARDEIWSLGHRNVQAAAINPDTGALWIAEHGTRGGDELNIVVKGGNYGWPDVAYGVEYDGKPIATAPVTQKSGTVQPVYYWDPIIAPGGMTFHDGKVFKQWKGHLFVTGLNGRHISHLIIDNDRVVAEERLLADLKERLRDIREGPDGALYVTTDPCGNGETCDAAKAKSGAILKVLPKVAPKK
jgi:glucose/arabinose dehydrogenase